MRKIVNVVLSIFIIFLFTACDDSSDNKDSDTKDADAVEVTDVDVVADEESKTDEDAALAYPEEGETSYKVGDVANNLEWNDSFGKTHKLEEFFRKNKLLMIVFSAYDCPGCQSLKSVVPETYLKFKDQGLEVLLLYGGFLQNAADEPDELTSQETIYFNKYGHDIEGVNMGYFPFYTQENSSTLLLQKLYNRWGIEGVPANYIINLHNMEIYDDQQWIEVVNAANDEYGYDAVIEAAISDYDKAYGTAE